MMYVICEITKYVRTSRNWGIYEGTTFLFSNHSYINGCLWVRGTTVDEQAARYR